MVTRPPSESTLRAGRRVRISGEHPYLGLGAEPHGEGPRVVGVQHAPAVRLGDLGDDRFDLGELVQGVDPADAQVVGADVGHHRDVVVRDPDAAAQDPTAGRLGDRQLHARVAQHLTGTARPGEVTGLDQLTIDVHAVGTRPAHRHAGPRAMWPIIRAVVVLPLVPVIATTGNARPDQPRSGTERRRGKHRALGS